MIWVYLEILAADLLITFLVITEVTGIIRQLGSCHGPAGGAPSAGVGGGVPAERIPRVTPPHLARRGKIANKIKKD
jgi:hypothetical protein